ncbi:hypothetical protein B0T18DRAFT_417599 [Schizothecium vesticola]|uniref:Uncharacterized protein n=1 Tax=Schizothecium vesticola TaxID=314040 RepID=A0AA40JYT3_9PEZI|nr:hypothetical protein B0T18DRAFT_417599 [Schizothecium vesticola]
MILTGRSLPCPPSLQGIAEPPALANLRFGPGDWTGQHGSLHCRYGYAPGTGHGRARQGWVGFMSYSVGARERWTVQFLEGEKGLCALRLQAVGGLEVQTCVGWVVWTSVVGRG